MKEVELSDGEQRGCFFYFNQILFAGDTVLVADSAVSKPIKRVWLGWHDGENEGEFE